MKLFEGKTPSERNKLIAAMVLGVVAFIALSYMLFGSTSSPKPRTQTANSNTAAGRRQTVTDVADRPVASLQTPQEQRANAESLSPSQPVIFTRPNYAVPEPGRNIFAFYVPPPPPVKVVITPTPTPTPPPPQVLASLSPMNVFARTGDFTLEVSGDKFTAATVIYVDNNPLPTRYINAQQLSASVPASMISNDGARQIKVGTPDGVLYSNTMPMMVAPPPIPNYLYIGIIGKLHYNDTAVLKDKGNPKELLNVQRGDLVGGRFRVTSISEREIVLTDTNLRIKHTLPFIEEKGGQAAGGSIDASGRRRGVNNQLLDSTESGIPGIPNVPRYQPPVQQQPPQQQQDDDDDEEIPGIPTKGRP